MEGNQAVQAPGMRHRVAAAGLDYLVILAWVAVVTGVGIAVRALAPRLLASAFASPWTGQLAGFVLLTLPVAAYFIVSEASPSGATWGKRRMGLRVTTLGGARIERWRSVARTLLKLAPWELSHFAVWQFAAGGATPSPTASVAIGMVWIAVAANLGSAIVSPRNRALYDFVSGTIIVDERIPGGTGRRERP